MSRLVCFLIAGLAVAALQATAVEAQVGNPNMPPLMAPPGAPGGPPPAGGAPLAEPDLDAMSDAELEAMFAEAPEEDAAMPPGGPGGPQMGAPGAPPMGAPPMGAPPMGAPPMGAPPVR